jgi:hypothetical protein
MQSIIHKADDAKRFGALDSFSAFAFENEFGHSKKLLRSGKAHLRQLCCRLAKQRDSSQMSDTTRSSLPVLTGLHSAGLTHGVQGMQYCKMTVLFGLLILVT